MEHLAQMTEPKDYVWLIDYLRCAGLNLEADTVCQLLRQFEAALRAKEATA